MIEVRQFEPGDFHDMQPRMWDAEKVDLGKHDMETMELALGAMKTGPSFTIVSDGVVAASFGLILCGPEAEAWVYFTPDVREIKAEFEKIVSTHLATLAVSLGLERIGCGIIKGYEHLMPWVERLGFQRIGERPGVTPEVRYELCLL